MLGQFLDALASPLVRPHVLAALEGHRRRLRRNGSAVPAELSVVVDFVSARLPRGPERTQVARPGGEADRRGKASFMTTRETAQELSCSERHVRRLAKSGQLAGVHFGRSVRFKRTAVESLVGRRRSGNAD